ncbi:hypothetical protein ACYZX9_03615 [Sphingomonas citri]
MIIDASINWGPAGEREPEIGFNLAEARDELLVWVRQIRGGIVSGTYAVERNINNVILLFMLGERLSDDAVTTAFTESMLDPLSFDGRINVVLAIAPHLMSPDDCKRFGSDLRELKTLRNAMAHKPSWFEPQCNEEHRITGLVPFIMRGKRPTPLTTEFIEHVNEQVIALIEQAQALTDAARARLQDRQSAHE